jgi:hypothetical protein
MCSHWWHLGLMVANCPMAAKASARVLTKSCTRKRHKHPGIDGAPLALTNIEISWRLLKTA